MTNGGSATPRRPLPLPGMEAPPHPMRLGETEEDYYVNGPELARQSGQAEEIGK